MDAPLLRSLTVKMCTSSGVSERRHTSLQQLQALTASAQTFLGPTKRLKFFQEELSTVLVGSCPRLLECFDMESSVTQLLNESIQAQQKTFHSGTSTLMFMAGAWSWVALEALNQGIQLSQIRAVMRRALEACMEACECSAVSLQDISGVKSDRQHLKSKLKHSRHFTADDGEDIACIAHAVTHGSDASMRLVLQAAELQSTHFDVRKLVTCTIPNTPEEHACALKGYVSRLSIEQIPLAQRLQHHDLNLALINGDLTESFRHLGFHRPADAAHVTDGMNTSSSEQLWIENTIKTLRNLSLEVVLVSGRIDAKLSEQCTDVLLLSGVSSNILKAFSTSAVPISYIAQLDPRCVGRARICGAFSWRSIVVTSERSSLVSVIVTSPLPAKLQMMEDDIWRCAYRLNQAISEGKLLPGAGATESICMRRLQEFQGDPEEALVVELMVEAWRRYGCTLWRNMDGESTSGAAVFDNMRVKFEAWRRALDLVLLLLQTDTEIITGVGGENKYNQLLKL